MKHLDTCPICKRSDHLRVHAKQVSTYDDRADNCQSISRNLLLKYLLGVETLEVNTVRCFNCGHLFLSPTFTRDEIERLYSPQTVKEFEEQLARRGMSWGEALGGTNWQERKAESLRIRPRIIRDVLNKYTARKSKILDIGGESGHNLTAFKDNSELFVLDLMEPQEKLECITYIRDYKSASTYAPFDIIISTHTLEHVVDLNEEIGNIRKIVRNGSYIYIEVPCQSFSIIRRKTGMHINGHVNLFTRNSLHNLLQLNGFSHRLLKLHLMPYNEIRLYTYIGVFEYTETDTKRLNRRFLYNFLKDGAFIARNKYFNADGKLTYRMH
jgi:SAM-dependent methyltransferase